MPPKRTPSDKTTQKESDAQTAAGTAITQTVVPAPTKPVTDAFRSKRKRGNDEVDDDEVSMEEIRELIRSNTAQTDSKLKLIQKAMTEIKEQNTGIKDCVDHISQQYDDMVIRMQVLEAERKSDRSYINQLEERLESLERTINSSKLEFKNIPKKQGETKEDLRLMVTETASVLESNLQREDIKDVYRLNKKEGTPTIVVEFTTDVPKESILKNLRKFNKTNNQNKLNTTHIKKEGPAKPIFIAEILTLKAQRLYYLARNFAKDNGYRFCWTSHGKIFLRKAEGGKQIWIKNESDINNLQLNN